MPAAHSLPSKLGPLQKLNDERHLSSIATTSPSTTHSSRLKIPSLRGAIPGSDRSAFFHCVKPVAPRARP